MSARAVRFAATQSKVRQTIKTWLDIKWAFMSFSALFQQRNQDFTLVHFIYYFLVLWLLFLHQACKGNLSTEKNKDQFPQYFAIYCILEVIMGIMDLAIRFLIGKISKKCTIVDWQTITIKRKGSATRKFVQTTFSMMRK